MIRSMICKTLLGVGLLQGSLLLSGCGSDASHHEESATTGTLSLPLLATAGAHTYRLQGGLYVSGPSFVFLDVNADTTVLTTTLQTGAYTANLYFWTLTRDDGAGNFVPVSATLVSSGSPSFTIFNQTTTTVSFQFETDGQIVTVGAGQLNVDIGVHETPPVCALLGSDCPAGSWCAPTELTGAALSCIAAGAVAEGAACLSPLDCAENSSCFDFGSGAVCMRLCASADFNQPCSSGETCTPQGIDYGVCRPDAAAADGSAGSHAE
jgi:hypothetical protein